MRIPTWRLLLVIFFLALGVSAAAYAFTWWKNSRDAKASPEALISFRLAQDSASNLDLETAKTHLRQCLNSWPLDAEVHFLLARLCRRSNDFAGWQIHLGHAEALQWSKEEVQRETILMRIQADALPSVEALVMEQLASGSIDKDLLLEAWVKRCLDQVRIDEAIRGATFWMEQSPRNGQALFLRGQANQARRAFDKAIADYEQALELQPNYAEALLGLADAHVLQGQYDLALQKYQSFLKLRPEHVGALFGVAHCQFFLGHKDEAKKSLQTLFVANQNHPAGVFLQGKILMEEGDNKEALAWLRRAEKLAPNEIDITYSLAGLLRKLDQIEEASQYDQKVQELRTGIARLEILRQQARQEPDNIDLRYEGATLFAKLGQEEEAERWFLIVLRLNPNHVPAHRALADYYQKKGDPRQAELHRRLAEKKGP
jgi:tetratricopeptide (TPR) repeat protein